MEQLQLFDQNEDIAKSAAEAEQTPPTEPVKPKAKPKRNPLPEHLERIDQVLAIGEDCSECGGDLSKLGEDITEELEYITGCFVVNKIIRPRISCSRCEVISQAPMPSRPIERGRPGPGCPSQRCKHRLLGSGSVNMQITFIVKARVMLAKVSIWIARQWRTEL